MEERRTHMSVDMSSRRLGMYLEPAGDDGFGAIVRAFEKVCTCGAESKTDANAAAPTSAEPPAAPPVEAEATASDVAAAPSSAAPAPSPANCECTCEAARAGVCVGFRITAVNDVELATAPFDDIIRALTSAPRPVRITFRDPRVTEWRDRYGFLRTKLHVEREAAYVMASAEAADASNRAWITFLAELGGARGTAGGVLRVARDACGFIVFPLEPAVRLNALSPLHGRMQGISHTHTHTDDEPSSSRRAGASSSKPSSSKPLDSSSSSGILGGTLTSPAPARPSEASSSTFVVVSIFKRCWSPGSIGVAQPPGLSVALPGDMPPPKVRDKWMSTLRRLVLTGGVPAAFRRAIWYEMSGAHAKAALHMPGYYASLVAAHPSSEAATAIAKDLDRTFPGHPFFETREGIASLQRLLTAFAVHNSDVGYCQSINFLAGFLLLLLPEEHAFWVLDVLVNEILPPNYYNSTLMGVHIDQRVLAHLVDELMPDVSEALQRAGVQLHLVVVEWFMCCFCTVLPAHAALRVWDALFLFGSEVLFRVGLVLFHQHASRILSVAASSTTTQVIVRHNSLGGASSHASPGDASSSISVSSTAPGGDDKPLLARLVARDKDTVAETAAKVLAAAGSMPSPGPAASRNVSASTSTSTGSTGAAAPLSPVVRGGTVRSPASTFPALFSMLKALPANAHDIDELLRQAYPASAKEARSCLPWDTHLTHARIAKLRAAARTVVQAEYDEAQAMRAGNGPVHGSSGAASSSSRAPPSPRDTHTQTHSHTRTHARAATEDVVEEPHV